ncbi:MAG: ribbon-helix-helix protein, CopG family [Halodesulfurarchaeum sp.]
MSGNDDGPVDEEMTKIDVRVPTQLLETVDETYAKRGYTSRSEAIRDAIRAWIDPPIRLSESALEDLATSREQRKRGETHTVDEVRKRLGLDDDESE